MDTHEAENRRDAAGEDDPIRISITEMLEESTIAEIGADHEDLAVCVTRICGELRITQEAFTAAAERASRAEAEVERLSRQIDHAARNY